MFLLNILMIISEDIFSTSIGTPPFRAFTYSWVISELERKFILKEHLQLSVLNSSYWIEIYLFLPAINCFWFNLPGIYLISILCETFSYEWRKLCDLPLNLLFFYFQIASSFSHSSNDTDPRSLNSLIILESTCITLHLSLNQKVKNFYCKNNFEW